MCEIPVLKPISNRDFWVTFMMRQPITFAGFNIHPNEAICKGLHHGMEYKHDWSSIQQSKYERWDNHTSKAAYFVLNKNEQRSTERMSLHVIRCKRDLSDYTFLICLDMERARFHESGFCTKCCPQACCPSFVKYVLEGCNAPNVKLRLE